MVPNIGRDEEVLTLRQVMGHTPGLPSHSVAVLNDRLGLGGISARRTLGLCNATISPQSPGASNLLSRSLSRWDTREVPLTWLLLEEVGACIRGDTPPQTELLARFHRLHNSL